MIMQLLKRIAIFSLWSVCVLSLSITKTYASTVTISQTGSVVTQSSLPKIDMYLWLNYVSKVPEDNYYIDVVLLDTNYNPVSTLFTAALASNNIPGAPPTAYSIYPRLTGLDTTKNYGIVLRSPATIDDASTNNKYGFAYGDSNPYANGFERLSTNGGSTWTTENSGNRDLMFTIYK